MKKIFLLIPLCIVILIIVTCVVVIQTKKNSCETSNGEKGTCVPIAECVDFGFTVRSLNSRNDQCITDESKPEVCCSSNAINASNTQIIKTFTTSIVKETFTKDVSSDLDDPLAPSIKDHPKLKFLPNNCGDLEDDRIIGGDMAGILEFPWMALISYRSAKGLKDFRCGGTIINNKHILTAAHCVTNLGNSTLEGVRVGEYDVTTSKDCEGNEDVGVCVTHQDILIDKTIVHHNYLDPQMNDIALIKLQQPLNMSNNVHPICLPIDNNTANERFENTSLIVTGWGITEYKVLSTILLKASLPIMTREKCNQILKNHNRTVNYRQICTDSSKGKDSAKGDSGGPLQNIDILNGFQKYVQHGIVSYGINRVLSVNTRISYYMDWILDQLTE